MRVIVRYGNVTPPAPPPSVVFGHRAAERVREKEAVVVITVGSPADTADLDPYSTEFLQNRATLENAARDMRLRDAEVRAHEQAHLSALGAYAAGPVTYGYATGPNGQAYAVSGSIKVDLSPVPGSPEATLRKAHAILTAALAPGEPSGPDMRVASEAYRLESHAQRQVNEMRGVSLSA